MTPDTVLLLVHALATVMMAGLIWFVQVVHYPLFRLVGEGGFAAYEASHAARTGRVVGPLMLVEAIAATWIAIAPPAGIARGPAAAGLGLVIVLWASTAGLQVPCHRRLATGFDARAWRRLVVTNWIRTVAWTARAVIALWMLTALP